MAAKDALGRRGEDLAAAYLTEQGLVVLDRNWRCRLGELDIVCTDSRRLVVCEVKTRSSTRFGLPAEAVDARKAHRIRQLAGAWLAAHHVPWVEVRYDVLAVLVEPGSAVRVHHYEAAF
jgi:putative endonuclease